MSDESIAQELLRLEDPILDSVGLVGALRLAVDGLDDIYDRRALKAVVDILDDNLNYIEETWREIQHASRDPAEVAQDEAIVAAAKLTPAEPSA
jgi:hypothetical protein